MDNHNEIKQSSWMMWSMVAVCLLPLLIVAFIGTGGKLTGTSPWMVFGIMVIFIAGHYFVMRKMHNPSKKNNTDSGSGKNVKRGHSGRHMCH